MMDIFTGIEMRYQNWFGENVDLTIEAGSIGFVNKIAMELLR